MAISEDLLKILVCPETKAPVRTAPEGLVASLNSLIERRSLKNRAGRAVEEKLDGGLLRTDGKILYPVRSDIPIMLIEEGIEVAQGQSDGPV